jgi:hypothetical protein
MATITVEIQPEEDLTIFKVVGELFVDEILEYSSKYYSENPTKFVIWDATEGTVRKINPDEFRGIANKIKALAHKRAGGKTAFVSKSDIDFGLSRMYEVYTESEEIPIKYRVFRNIEDAIKWVNE